MKAECNNCSEVAEVVPDVNVCFRCFSDVAGGTVERLSDTLRDDAATDGEDSPAGQDLAVLQLLLGFVNEKAAQFRKYVTETY